MRFIEMWGLLDSIHPIWINDESGECEYFENKDEVDVKYANRLVHYITQDAEGVLTIEVERRKER